MKIMRMTLMAVLLMAIGQVAWAQCPDAIGQWSTTNGTMIGGRASEAWCGMHPYPVMGGVPGNTQNAMSWNGVALGTQWKAWGMSIVAPGAVLLLDTVNPVTGDGFKLYSTNYVDGQFWLSKSNTWSDGVADLTGALHSFNVTTKVTYNNFALGGATSDISFTGTFANCPGANGCEIQFGILNALLVWNPALGGTMPTGYPALLCGATTGEVFDVCCITIDIFCVVGTEERSWGSVKALFK